MLMRIQVLADLHTEFAQYEIELAEGADVLVLAGDYTVAASLEKLEALAQTTEKPIVFVAGNHEYYRGIFDRVNEELRRIGSSQRNFHFLNNECFQYEGVQFIGTTLWSNFDLAPDFDEFVRMAGLAICDFDCIATSTIATFSPYDCIKLNEQSRSFLKDKTSASSCDKKVVVTHFGPSPKSIHPRFAGNVLNPYFCCNCEELMGPSIPLWIHGHTHESINYEHKKTRVIANPRGYYGENRKFKGKLIVEI
jgi:Icc-related predicted phosphoesterase